MTAINLNERDRQTLRLLTWTTASAALIHSASQTFDLPEDEEPFRDERRVRERMLALDNAGLIRASTVARQGGGVVKWYRPTHSGYRTVTNAAEPPKAFFEPIKITRQEHTTRLAAAIVHTHVAAHSHRITIDEQRRENELRIVGGHRVQFPDFFFRLRSNGRLFNMMLELDNGTEPVDSDASNSIREKLLTYEAHQDYVLRWWIRQGKPRRPNPRFRVVFLTRTAERAEHIASLAATLATNADRSLCLTAALDDYLTEADALRSPMFLDHHGHWQAIVNAYPSALPTKASVRLAEHGAIAPSLVR